MCQSKTCSSEGNVMGANNEFCMKRAARTYVTSRVRGKTRQQRKKWDKPAEQERRYKDAAAAPQRKNLLWGKYSRETWGREEPQE